MGCGKIFLRLKKPFDKYEFVQSASTVNAFFTFRMNSLTLPAGFLTSPFFNRYYPKAANYGALGTVMGHELTHGFDDDGSLYDMNGNLNNWWSKESYKNFRNKAQCFIEQYDSYKVPNTDFKVNGKLTLGKISLTTVASNNHFGHIKSISSKSVILPINCPACQSSPTNKYFSFRLHRFGVAIKRKKPKSSKCLLMNIAQPSIVSMAHSRIYLNLAKLSIVHLEVY
ncbi:Peptidase M13 family protein [Brugia pahangi]